MTVEAIEEDEAICVFSLGGKQRLKLAVLEKVPEEHHWWDREQRWSSANPAQITPYDRFPFTAA